MNWIWNIETVCMVYGVYCSVAILDLYMVFITMYQTHEWYPLVWRRWLVWCMVWIKCISFIVENGNNWLWYMSVWICAVHGCAMFRQNDQIESTNKTPCQRDIASTNYIYLWYSLICMDRWLLVVASVASMASVAIWFLIVILHYLYVVFIEICVQISCALERRYSVVRTYQIWLHVETNYYDIVAWHFGVLELENIKCWFYFDGVFSNSIICTEMNSLRLRCIRQLSWVKWYAEICREFLKHLQEIFHL